LNRAQHPHHKKDVRFQRIGKAAQLLCKFFNRIFGLASALSWGAGDFTGGLAARKVGAYRSVFYAEVIGILFLFIVLLFVVQPLPDSRRASLRIAAGMLGTIGLMLLYHSMALGLMSIAAPVSALLAAVMPVVVGMFTEGLPDFHQP
jgi:uncharacterized membrane protein